MCGIRKALGVRTALIADEKGRDRAAELAAGLGEARLLEPPAGDRSATERLAEALVAFEGDLSTDPPEIVVLVGSGDIPLAGALVATKLGLRLFRVETEASDDDPVARILSILVPDSGPSYTESR
jgi:NADPH-dependent 2,4-dienoyl-CoA reductase/sulfur reductase-like enzyme